MITNLLCRYCENGQTEEIETLLRRGANPNFPSAINNRSPLHAAAEFGQLEAVKIIVNAGGYIDPRDKFGFTPLMLAAIQHGSQKQNGLSKASLLKKGMKEIEETYKQLIYFLIKNNAAIGAKDHAGNTIVHIASSLGTLEGLIALLQDADGSETTELGKLLRSPGWGYLSPLHYACDSGMLSTIKFLVSKNVHVNACDAAGWTPMHWAAKSGHSNVCIYLKEHGGKSDSDDFRSITPKNVADMFDHVFLGNILRGAAEIHNEIIPHDTDVTSNEIPEEIYVVEEDLICDDTIISIDDAEKVVVVVPQMMIKSALMLLLAASSCLGLCDFTDRAHYLYSGQTSNVLKSIIIASFIFPYCAYWFMYKSDVRNIWAHSKSSVGTEKYCFMFPIAMVLFVLLNLWVYFTFLVTSVGFMASDLYRGIELIISELRSSEEEGDDNLSQGVASRCGISKECPKEEWKYYGTSGGMLADINNSTGQNRNMFDDNNNDDDVMDLTLSVEGLPAALIIKDNERPGSNVLVYSYSTIDGGGGDDSKSTSKMGPPGLLLPTTRGTASSILGGNSGNVKPGSAMWNVSFLKKLATLVRSKNILLDDKTGDYSKIEELTFEWFIGVVLTDFDNMVDHHWKLSEVDVVVEGLSRRVSTEASHAALFRFSNNKKKWEVATQTDGFSPSYYIKDNTAVSLSSLWGTRAMPTKNPPLPPNSSEFSANSSLWETNIQQISTESEEEEEVSSSSSSSWEYTNSSDATKPSNDDDVSSSSSSFPIEASQQQPQSTYRSQQLSQRNDAGVISESLSQHESEESRRRRRPSSSSFSSSSCCSSSSSNTEVGLDDEANNSRRVHSNVVLETSGIELPKECLFGKMVRTILFPCTQTPLVDSEMKVNYKLEEIHNNHYQVTTTAETCSSRRHPSPPKSRFVEYSSSKRVMMVQEMLHMAVMSDDYVDGNSAKDLWNIATNLSSLNSLLNLEALDEQSQDCGDNNNNNNNNNSLLSFSEMLMHNNNDNRKFVLVKMSNAHGILSEYYCHLAQNSSDPNFRAAALFQWRKDFHRLTSYMDRAFSDIAGSRWPFYYGSSPTLLNEKQEKSKFKHPVPPFQLGFSRQETQQGTQVQSNANSSIIIFDEPMMMPHQIIIETTPITNQKIDKRNEKIRDTLLISICCTSVYFVVAVIIVSLVSSDSLQTKEIIPSVALTLVHCFINLTTLVYIQLSSLEVKNRSVR